MSTTSLYQKIEKVANIFHNIRDAIIEKNPAMLQTEKPENYATYIRGITQVLANEEEHFVILALGNIHIEDYNITSSTTMEEVLNSEVYDILLENEATAAFLAYSSQTLSNYIKNHINLLVKALTCSYKEWFYTSQKNYLENINNYIEPNPYVTETSHSIVQCSSEKDDYPAWYAFDDTIDIDDINVVYKYRHIWVAGGQNQWVQYTYSTPKQIFSIKVYSIRDNAPTHISIYGTNVVEPNEDDFDLIKSQQLSGTIGSEHYDEVICPCNTKYKTYRFVVKNSVADEEYIQRVGNTDTLDTTGFLCVLGEIRIYTFKEE